jgi:hypothetical protein
LLFTLRMRNAHLLALCGLTACGFASPPAPGSSPTSPTVPGQTPTWNQDVQPLVAENCGGCHVTGGIAPFSLETYADAQLQAVAMEASVQSHAMPPWMPDEDGCEPLKGSRRLSDDQVAVITAWAEGGAPEGDAVTTPPVQSTMQALDWVDDTLEAASDYTPPPNVTDDYHCFILPRQDTVDHDIIGMDVQPDHRQMVHHVIAYAMDAATAQQQDDAEAGEGWTCFGGPGGTPYMLGGWVPGTSATSYPAGTGIPLTAAQVVVIQVHYNLQNFAAVPDRTQLKLQFSKQPVPTPAQWTAMADWSFAIPPNTMNYQSSSNIASPGAGHVWGVFPHMHTLGTSITVRKSGQCLVNIPKWDFHWQQSFFFNQTQGLPFAYGENVSLSCTWNNTTNNVVTWGEKTSDEMCLAFFYVTQ